MVKATSGLQMSNWPILEVLFTWILLTLNMVTLSAHPSSNEMGHCHRHLVIWDNGRSKIYYGMI